MDSNMSIAGSFRKGNGAFLDYFKSNKLHEREKSIHNQLDDERKKYFELKNKRKTDIANGTEKIMPVTNVITHVRKSNVNTHFEDGNNDIVVEGNMLNYKPCSDTKQVRHLGNSMTGQKQYTVNDHNLRGKCNPDGRNDKTCKCCGTKLIVIEEKQDKEESNMSKLVNQPDLESLITTNKYPITTVDLTRTKNKIASSKEHFVSNDTTKCYSVPKMKKTSGTHSLEILQESHKTKDQRNQEQIVVYGKEDHISCFDASNKTDGSSHWKNNLGPYPITTNEHMKKEQEYQINQNQFYEIKKYEDKTMLRSKEYELKTSSENQSNESNDEWMEEVKHILIKMGNSITFGTKKNDRLSEIKTKRLASWCLARWKLYTENNKNRRQKVENLKAQRELNIMRRYFYKWKGKSDCKKEEKIKRAEKIDFFLDVLRSKQQELQLKENSSRATKPSWTLDRRSEFKNRLDVQNNIIKSQKQKLAEAEDEIKTMKLKQILVQSKISRNTVEENIRETVQNIHPKLKIVANQIMKIEHDKKTCDEKAKKLVESMEQRARERKLKWQQIQEIKKHRAEEQVKLLQDQEAKRLQDEDDRKKRKIMELKEKRKLEQEIAIKREKERRRLNSLSVIAENFHKKKLMQRGFRGFKENLKTNLVKMELAEKFYIYQLKRRYFYEWKFYTEEITSEKENIAVHFYNYILKRRVLDSFKEMYNARVLNLQVAIDFRELKIQEKYFSKWRAFYRWRQRIFRRQMKEADQYFCRKLLLYCFLQWKRLPEIAFLEREKDKRLRDWRDKVKEILPDFVPFEVE